MGPTAVGKTTMAIKIAKHFKTEIISADSRQFYAEMNIGTAKPDKEELHEVKHHFIGNASINQLYSAGDFERDALKKLEELFITKNIVVMVGGSGLYIKAVCEGLHDMPKADEELRIKLQSIFDNEGIGPLQEMLKELDPDKYETIDIQNTQRVMRAIEIAGQSKKDFSSFTNTGKSKRNFNIIRIGLNLPREILYDRINKRVDEMIETGLQEEVCALISFKHLNALQTVGYTEFFAHFEGKYSFEKAVELIKQHTRNFAKRQLTWFRKEKEVSWFGPDEFDAIVEAIKRLQ